MQHIINKKEGVNIKSVKINEYLRINASVMKKNADYPQLKLHKVWKQLGNRLLIEYDLTFANKRVYQIRVNSEPGANVDDVKKFVNDWNHCKYESIWKNRRQQLIDHEVKVAEAKIKNLKNEIKEMK